MIEIGLEIAQWAGILLLLYANGEQAKAIGLLMGQRLAAHEERDHE